MAEIVDTINGYIWSDALIYLCLGAGLFFSIITRFVQVRMFREMLHLLFSGKESEKGISSFQALAVSLSGRVGTGNIAGVAAAIGFGGPGAVFWMWVVAFLVLRLPISNPHLVRFTKKSMRASTVVVRPTTSRKRWVRSGTHGSSPLRPSLPLACCCRPFNPMPSATPRNSLLAAAQTSPRSSAPSARLNSLPQASSWWILGFIIFGGVKRIAHFTQVVVPIHGPGLHPDGRRNYCHQHLVMFPALSR